MSSCHMSMTAAVANRHDAGIYAKLRFRLFNNGSGIRGKGIRDTVKRSAKGGLVPWDNLSKLK